MSAGPARAAGGGSAKRTGGGPDPPGIAYVQAPDRKAERPIAHLAGFRGVLQVDGYGGYEVLAERGDIRLACCPGRLLTAVPAGCGSFVADGRWSHVRRRFYELAQAGPDPIASEALIRIGGIPAEERRAIRQENSRPVIEALEPLSASRTSRPGIGPPEARWLRGKLALISQKTQLALAIRDAPTRWAGLRRLLDDSRIEIDSNLVERPIRPLALQRKNALFAGSDGGAEPHGYLTDVTTRIFDGHPQSRIDQLLSWAYPADPKLTSAA